MSDTDVATISPLFQELVEEERNVWATDKIENVLRILTKRFDSVPSTVYDHLHAIHDLNVLRQLTDVAWDCQTLAEFENALNK